MGTKYINGEMIHECIKEIAISSEENNGASFAEYLAAVISLTRIVTWDFEAIQLMLKIVQQDDLTFLATPTTVETRYREDFDEDEGSQAFSAELEWEEDKKKLRVLGSLESGLDELLPKTNLQYVSFS